METTLLIKITHQKPIEDLIDKAAGRIYSMSGVDDVNAVIGDIPAHIESMRRMYLIGEFD